MTEQGWYCVLVYGRVIEQARRVGDDVVLNPRAPDHRVPWSIVERWRQRASFQKYGDAPWRDGPAAQHTQDRSTTWRAA